MTDYVPIFIIILQLIFLEGILSIDNAAVIGALVSPLPNDKPVEWPRTLQRLGDWLHPILGNQRLAALRVGLLGAYVGRGAMLFLTSFLINNSWIKLVGAAYLIRLAFDNLEDMAGAGSEEDEELHLVKAQSFWPTVLTVETMDLIFSIDNVVAAVSLSNKIWVDGGCWYRYSDHAFRCGDFQLRCPARTDPATGSVHPGPEHRRGIDPAAGLAY